MRKSGKTSGIQTSSEPRCHSSFPNCTEMKTGIQTNKTSRKKKSLHSTNMNLGLGFPRINTNINLNHTSSEIIHTFTFNHL